MNDRIEPRQSGSRHGVLIAVLGLAGVAAIVIGGILPRLRARAALRSETYQLAMPTVSVMHPRLGALQEEIALPGNIQAFSEAAIYARTSGYLKRWYADIGTHVKAGQILAEIEAPEIDQQLQQARADLKVAEANFQLAEITAQRYKELWNANTVSKQEMDNAAGSMEAKRATTNAARFNVNRLEALQSFKKIEAPFAGVITARNTDVGALIDSGATGGVARELFHIAATHKLRVFVNMPQQYSQVARPGLSADLAVKEFPGRKFKGTLARTANSIESTSRTLLVEVEVNNPEGTLLPGAYAEVHFKLPLQISTFIVPVNTLIFRSQGVHVAVVRESNQITLVPILLGRDYGNEVEVLTGLAAEDRVVINPPDSVIEGEKVQVVQASNKAEKK
ncbi:MAG TPA: efflux RND transporter periplasmic adaptor subunit [Candidatus Dormibacteraeota bacterium]|nr:efflux RND transporter periplasmic adaptor subunit [Candidatus Dormibacteraeota bacterium]